MSSVSFTQKTWIELWEQWSWEKNNIFSLRNLSTAVQLFVLFFFFFTNGKSLIDVHFAPSSDNILKGICSQSLGLKDIQGRDDKFLCTVNPKPSTKPGMWKA